MKTVFNTLFKYNYYTNLKITKVILESPALPPDCIRLMSHIINAQQAILGRLAPEYQRPVAIWDLYEKTELDSKLAEDNENWIHYLKTIPEEDFIKMLTFKNGKGDVFENRIQDIIFHIINHSTHHRGQISLLLRQNGIAPPVTDYIFYLREVA